MSECAPGAVAVATVRGVKGVRVFRYTTGGWVSGERVNATRLHGDHVVTDIRPLVVLDLDPTLITEDMGARRNEPQRFVDMLREAADNFFSTEAARLARKVADQIEAQTRPPRIPEPGIGHFVNARKPDRTHANFVRITKRSWVELGDGGGWDWDDLIDPVEVEGGAA